MAKVKGNKAVLNNTEEKIVTKYDKKISIQMCEATYIFPYLQIHL